MDLNHSLRFIIDFPRNSGPKERQINSEARRWPPFHNRIEIGFKVKLLVEKLTGGISVNV
jgi:hypothetical protein